MILAGNSFLLCYIEIVGLSFKCPMPHKLLIKGLTLLSDLKKDRLNEDFKDLHTGRKKFFQS